MHTMPNRYSPPVEYCKEKFSSVGKIRLAAQQEPRDPCGLPQPGYVHCRLESVRTERTCEQQVVLEPVPEVLATACLTVRGSHVSRVWKSLEVEQDTGHTGPSAPLTVAAGLCLAWLGGLGQTLPD